MEKMLMRLKKGGYKITPQRRAVLEAMLAFKEFPTAQQILTEVKKKNPAVSVDTIYRNMNILVGLGLLNEIHMPSGGCVYELVTTPHHHHMICLGCGRTECIDWCPLDEAVQAAAQAKGFALTGHMAEFYGFCPQCQNEGRNREGTDCVKKDLASSRFS